MVTLLELWAWARGCVGKEWVHFQSAAVASDSRGGTAPGTRGLHSSTFLLNLSAFCGIGDARRGYVARDKGF